MSMLPWSRPKSEMKRVAHGAVADLVEANFDALLKDTAEGDWQDVNATERGYLREALQDILWYHRRFSRNLKPKPQL